MDAILTKLLADEQPDLLCLREVTDDMHEVFKTRASPSTDRVTARAQAVEQHRMTVGIERSQETGPALGVRAAACCIRSGIASAYAVACRLPFLPRSPAAG